MTVAIDRMNAIVTTGSRSWRIVLPAARPRIDAAHAADEHRHEREQRGEEHERAGGGEEIEPERQRIRRRLGHDRRFALHERDGLAGVEAIRARPTEFPDREAEPLRIGRRRLADPRIRAQLVAALAAAQQRRDVGRRPDLRHPGEISRLTDEHGDDEDAVGRVGADHAAAPVSRGAAVSDRGGRAAGEFVGGPPHLQQQGDRRERHERGQRVGQLGSDEVRDRELADREREAGREHRRPAPRACAAIRRRA